MQMQTIVIIPVICMIAAVLLVFIPAAIFVSGRIDSCPQHRLWYLRALKTWQYDLAKRIVWVAASIALLTGMAGYPLSGLVLVACWWVSTSLTRRGLKNLLDHQP